MAVICCFAKWPWRFVPTKGLDLRFNHLDTTSFALTGSMCRQRRAGHDGHAWLFQCKSNALKRLRRHKAACAALAKTVDLPSLFVSHAAS